MDVPEDPFAVMNAAYELSEQYKAADGAVDFEGLAAALQEQFPDKTEEIQSVIQLLRYATMFSPETEAPSESAD